MSYDGGLVTEDDVFAKLCEVVDKQFNEVLERDMLFKEIPEWDSLSGFEVVMQLEEYYGNIQLSTSEVDRLNSVDGLVKAFTKHINRIVTYKNK